MNTITKSALLAIAVVAVVFVMVMVDPPTTKQEVKKDQLCKIKKIEIINGHTFDILLENNERIYSKLEISTPPKAVQEVRYYFNFCTQPRVKLINQVDDVWTVDMIAKVNGKEKWLSEFLQNQGLAYQ